MRSAIKMASLTAVGAAMILPAAAQRYEDPSNLDEGNWVSLTGQISSIDEDSFHMEYPGGEIEVEFEMMSGDPNEDRLRTGQQITAYGYVDDDFLEGAVLEAEGVYVTERNSYYGSMDDSWGTAFLTVGDWSMNDGTMMTLEGEVVSKDGREFTLDVGGTEIEVDTADMSSNPLDNRGYPQIDRGDRVSVYGTLEDTLFDNQELSASTILIDNRI
jgi:uncharacterized protein YdeI (BOF family)